VASLLDGVVLIRRFLMKKIILFLCCFVLLAGCSSSDENIVKPTNSQVVKLAVSNDGEYVITANSDENAYLWNLKDKTYKKVNKEPINTNSVYFVPDSDEYMYQLANSSKVLIKNIDGKVIKTFNPVFTTFGEAINHDLTTYVASDYQFNIYSINLKTNKRKQLFVSWCSSVEKDNKYNSNHPYKGKLPNGCIRYQSKLHLYGWWGKINCHPRFNVIDL
jgi:WD40 repeat protein